MAPNRITRSGATRRGLAAAALTVLLLAAVAGCGGGSGSTGSATTDATAREVDAPAAQPSPDAGALNAVLARQEAAVEAFAQVIPALPPRLAHLASYFRAQEQEHVDAVLKVMRGAARIAVEPSSESIEVGELGSDRERLVFLYEVESATIDEELRAIADLETTSARTMLAATVANQAQHLTLLRQALGDGPLASVPEPFEDGTTEPPE
jgi:Ferritin-like domain